VVEALEALLDELKGLRKTVKNEAAAQIAKKAIRDRANEIGSRWHREFASKVRGALAADACDRYDANFTQLIRLTSPNNRRTSYLNVLDALISKFRDELIIPAKQGSFSAPPASAFDSFFAALGNPDESDYLKEAIACARAGYFRAAAVLGWSAAIDRIHRKIDATGFTQFNVTSARMASQQTGRYKKFNQVQNVNSLGEIREVFDTIILWIVEGMGLIDTNQHTRLRSCFDMRCQGAHPGDAPITSFNLLSFFSDLDQIVFSNPNFRI